MVPIRKMVGHFPYIGLAPPTIVFASY